MSADTLDRIRDACARVMARARSVRIDATRLSALAGEVAQAPPPPAGLDPAQRGLGSPEARLAYVLTLGAVNFGSGWFPHLRKRPGVSGYFTVATALERSFAARGPWSPAELRRLGPAECAAVFGQDLDVPEQAELMALFARALGDLGRWLLEHHGGGFAAAVEAAQGSAARLVEMLAAMPLYRDVACYDGLEVPFYKRAQLTAADLAAAFGGRGWGGFRDLGALTMFADNLVPHVLRLEGVLVYASDLARRIDAGERIAAGSPQEVEIRAGAVHAGELCVAEIAAGGGRTTARQLDLLLWSRGQRPEVKARPRHRTRSTFY